MTCVKEMELGLLTVLLLMQVWSKVGLPWPILHSRLVSVSIMHDQVQYLHCGALGNEWQGFFFLPFDLSSKKKKWFFMVAVNSTRFTTSSGLADSEEFFKTQASICLHIFLSRKRLLHLTHEFWPLKCTVYVCFTPPPGGQEVYQKQQHDVHWI